MEIIANSSVETEKFIPIYLGSLIIDSHLDFDLYLHNSSNYVLYRASRLPFTEDCRRMLLENGIDRLYVPAKMRQQWQQYVEDHIPAILNDEHIDDETKAGIVYDTTRLLIMDIFDNPAKGRNIKRSQSIVESISFFILRGPATFQDLLKVMSFDYSTYTHSVNVCALSLALARESGITSAEDLKTLGTGALLLDVGKIKISESLLNKRGKLSDEEMKLMKKHPEWGSEIIHETNLIPEDSYCPIIQHHERENGSGYPNGLKSSEIHDFSKVVAIVDAFDAMTTRRVYREAISTYPALKSMFDDKGAFNRGLLEHFASLLGPSDLIDK